MSRLAEPSSSDWSNPSGSTSVLQFRNRGADHRRRTLPPTDRPTTSSAQIFASLVFDLSYFYAIVADFYTRVQYLFSKPRYLVLMSSHLSRSRAVREYESVSRDTRNSRSESEHQNV